MKRLDELALITRCVLADDRRAFGQLVEAYQPQVRRMLMNLTLGDAMLCDDLAQETFLKAYVNLRSFKGVSRFSTWLYRIAYNEFYAYRRQRQDASLDDYAHEAASRDADDDVETALTVQQALARLSDAERTAVTLFYLEEQPIKRIATIMQIPEGTVKSHLHHAKRHLSKIIDSSS